MSKSVCVCVSVAGIGANSSHFSLEVTREEGRKELHLLSLSLRSEFCLKEEEGGNEAEGNHHAKCTVGGDFIRGRATVRLRRKITLRVQCWQKERVETTFQFAEKDSVGGVTNMTVKILCKSIFSGVLGME